jgi:hypothetical protein
MSVKNRIRPPDSPAIPLLRSVAGDRDGIASLIVSCRRRRRRRRRRRHLQRNSRARLLKSANCGCRSTTSTPPFANASPSPDRFRAAARPPGLGRSPPFDADGPLSTAGDPFPPGSSRILRQEGANLSPSKTPPRGNGCRVLLILSYRYKYFVYRVFALSLKEKKSRKPLPTASNIVYSLDQARRRRLAGRSLISSPSWVRQLLHSSKY